MKKVREREERLRWQSEQYRGDERETEEQGIPGWQDGGNMTDKL